jgi:ABC-2 type transport system permease protein
MVSAWKTLYWRELRSYVNTPIGYVFAVICLLLAFFLFFQGFFVVPSFWRAQEASIKGFFTLLPGIFPLLIPAISMRLWAEERKTGTLELLSTLPFRDWELVVAKFLAAWSVVASVVLASIPLALTTAIIGDNFDWGAHLAMYCGALLMAGAYVSMGMVVSALTREQIVAFLVVFGLSIGMLIMQFFATITAQIDSSVARAFGYFSPSYHHSSFGDGLIQFSDVFYYATFIGLMLALNVWILRRER